MLLKSDMSLYLKSPLSEAELTWDVLAINIITYTNAEAQKNQENISLGFIVEKI